MKNTDKLIDRLWSYLDSAEAFLGKEIPIYVTEYLQYEAWYHQQWLMWGFTPFLVFTAIAFVLAGLVKDAEDSALSCIVGAAVFLFFAILTVPHSWVKLNKIKMAPRVYLMEELRK